MPIYVRKASGDRQEFSPEKIRKTCLHAGATQELADKVTAEVSRVVYDGISTREILKLIVGMLEKELPHAAARYDLKGAIMRLGPAGFAFEELVAEILSRIGYKTQRDVIVTGACVEHEIDIIAERKNELGENERVMIECKYHNQPGIFTGLKEALYTWARFLDLQEGCTQGKCVSFDQAWLVCNTKCSEKAIKYSQCRGLTLMGWSWPHEKSLKRLLEENNLYPITILRKLDRSSQERMVAASLMLCEDLVELPIDELQRKTGIGRMQLQVLMEEAKSIISADRKNAK